MEDLKLVDRLWLSRLRAVNPEHKKALKHRHAQGVKPIENIVYMNCRRKRGIYQWEPMKMDIHKL